MPVAKDEYNGMSLTEYLHCTHCFNTASFLFQYLRNRDVTDPVTVMLLSKVPFIQQNEDGSIGHRSNKQKVEAATLASKLSI